MTKLEKLEKERKFAYKALHYAEAAFDEAHVTTAWVAYEKLARNWGFARLNWTAASRAYNEEKDQCMKYIV